MGNVISKTPWWFWLIVGVFLFWSLVGCGMYLAEHLMGDATYVEKFGAELLPLREITPWWSTSGYAVGVWGGLVGVTLLILRKKICLPFLYASFVGSIIGFMPYIFDERFKAVMSLGDYGFMIFIWLECIFIIWFARKMLAKGIIR